MAAPGLLIQPRRLPRPAAKNRKDCVQLNCTQSIGPRSAPGGHRCPRRGAPWAGGRVHRQRIGGRCGRSAGRPLIGGRAWSAGRLRVAVVPPIGGHLVPGRAAAGARRSVDMTARHTAKARNGPPWRFSGRGGVFIFPGGKIAQRAGKWPLRRFRVFGSSWAGTGGRDPGPVAAPGRPSDRTGAGRRACCAARAGDRSERKAAPARAARA